MYSLNTGLGTPSVGGKSVAAGPDWFSSKDLKVSSSKSPRNVYRSTRENETPRQRKKTGMERWEDHLSDFHLQPRTAEQQRAIKSASQKVPFKPLANANSLPKWHTSQTQTANAMMAFHGVSPKSRKAKSQQAAERPEWRGPSASDPKWKQLKDWHNRDNVTGSHQPPVPAASTMPLPRKVAHKVQPKPLETPLPMSIPHPSYHPKSKVLSEVLSSQAPGSVVSSVSPHNFKRPDTVDIDDTSSHISKTESIASMARWAGTSS